MRKSRFTAEHIVATVRDIEREPDLETKAADTFGPCLDPRSTRRCSAWMRRQRFRRSTVLRKHACPLIELIPTIHSIRERVGNARSSPNS